MNPEENGKTTTIEHNTPDMVTGCFSFYAENNRARCIMCEYDWPDDEGYINCPECSSLSITRPKEKT